MSSSAKPVTIPVGPPNMGWILDSVAIFPNLKSRGIDMGTIHIGPEPHLDGCQRIEIDANRQYSCPGCHVKIEKVSFQIMGAHWPLPMKGRGWSRLRSGCDGVGGLLEISPRTLFIIYTDSGLSNRDIVEKGVKMGSEGIYFLISYQSVRTLRRGCVTALDKHIYAMLKHSKKRRVMKR